MIKEIKAYEVNGKIFSKKEGALEEVKKTKGREYTRVAYKYLTVLLLINSYAKVINQSGLCEAYIEVTDKELVEEWDVRMPYADAFREYLKKEHIKYQSTSGDERAGAYLKVSVDKRIDNLPTVEEIAEFIKLQVER